MTATRAPATARAAKSNRRHELDWLRTAAVFGLIPFHTAVMFTTGSYDYVKNAQTSTVMDTLTTFVSIWGIPLLFLVAGASSRFALASRTTAQFLNERVMRLLIPFVFGLLLIVPLQIYIGQLAATPPPLPVFYLGFLMTLLGVLTGHFPAGPEWIGHLWFIPPLMAFSALAPLFPRILRMRWAAKVVDALASRGHGYAALALLGLPLAAVQLLTLDGIGLISTSDTRVAGNAVGILAFFIFFLYGYLLYADERFVSNVRRDAWPALLLGVAAWLVIVGVIPQWGLFGANTLLSHAIVALVRGYCSWWLVMAILGLAIRHLRFTTPIVDYLSRAAYPVYIIHMPIISFIGLWIVRLDMNIWLKFGVITVLGLAASIAVYDLLVRRNPALRLVFGLRAGGHSSPPPTPTLTTPARVAS
ncbi:MAG TPA: acyltransferase family protein [Ktedonobacterales bacterium]|nr:acyltransferase family protein [Ktedonobacterales bacterium]